MLPAASNAGATVRTMSRRQRHEDRHENIRGGRTKDNETHGSDPAPVYAATSLAGARSRLRDGGQLHGRKQLRGTAESGLSSRPHDHDRRSPVGSREARCWRCDCTLCLNACGDKVCAGVGRPAVDVTVLDSLTGARRERDASVLVYALDRGGVRVDSVRGVRDSVPISAAVDEAGLMRVVVQRPGYVTWTRASILVHQQPPACTTITESLLAKLQPAG